MGGGRGRAGKGRGWREGIGKETRERKGRCEAGKGWEGRAREGGGGRGRETEGKVKGKEGEEVESVWEQMSRGKGRGRRGKDGGEGRRRASTKRMAFQRDKCLSELLLRLIYSARVSLTTCS